jgi:beta-glucosidase
LAARFDPELGPEYGNMVDSETATYGQHVLEGPGLGLHRIPTGGRNFEHFSEGPYRFGGMRLEVVRAIHAHGRHREGQVLRAEGP